MPELCWLSHSQRQRILRQSWIRYGNDFVALNCYRGLDRRLDGEFRLIPLRTFVSLPRAERRLILRTLPLVAAIRVALWVAPLRRVGRMIRACERLPFSVPSDLPVSRLEWAVRAASRRVPMASCLTQALALQFLLARSGRSSEIHIGVKKDAQAGFQSHAWVECEGRMLLSTPSEIAEYSHLLALDTRPH
jgi:hypothetical protein